MTTEVGRAGKAGQGRLHGLRQSGRGSIKLADSRRRDRDSRGGEHIYPGQRAVERLPSLALLPGGFRIRPGRHGGSVTEPPGDRLLELSGLALEPIAVNGIGLDRQHGLLSGDDLVQPGTATGRIVPPACAQASSAVPT